uniref:Cyclin-G-associated kinase n=1 Tax=Toxocara canis TaxID=6265 RepID=A0A183US88_TOXCA
LGCILFYLCYRKHPFEDSAKLRIINAKYILPEGETEYSMFHPLIPMFPETTLQVDPRRRPLASDLCERAGALAAAMGIDLTKPVEGLDLPQLAPAASINATAGMFTCQLQKELTPHGSDVPRNVPPPRPPPAILHRTDHAHEQTAQQQASAMLGAIKGQGMTWFKNIKDKTAAVALTVQSTYGGRGPDVTFVTSRLVIAPLADGVPEALASQAEDAMRLHVMEQARGQFAVYNLSQRRLRCDYGNRLSETPMPPQGSGRAPTLNMLIGVCRNMALFLRQKPTNFIVITGPEAQCVLMACAILLYTRLLEKPLSAVELVCKKRTTPSLPPSYIRQLDVLRTVVTTEEEDLRAMVHNRRVLLESILISPPPAFNRIRTGCRPIVEIYSAGNKLWSTVSDYEELQTFELPECSVVDLDLGRVPVADDVQVIVYHARWVKMQNRMQQHLMFSASFHANFIDPNTHLLEMNRTDLDILPDEESKFGDAFRVGIRVHVEDNDRGFNADDLPAFLTYDSSAVSRMALVSDHDEYDAIMHHLDIKKKSVPSCPQRPPRPQQSPRMAHTQRTEAAEKLLQSQQIANHPQNDPFFSTVSTATQSTSPKISRAHHESTQKRQSPQELMQSQQQQQDPFNLTKSLTASTASGAPLTGTDKAEMYEQMCGIRVSRAEEPPNEDDEKYKFDYEKAPKQSAVEDQESQLATDVDLLGLGGDVGVFSGRSSSTQGELGSSSEQPFDPFADFEAKTATNPFAHKSASSAAFCKSEKGGGVTAEVDDLLDWSSTPVSETKHDRITGLSAVNSSNMQRNVSAPSFATATSNGTATQTFDPFAEFLASTSNAPVSKSGQGSRTNLSSIRPKVTENAFDDLLTSQGFLSTSRSAKTINEMKRADEIKTLDPISIKIRDWTNGKERNIRALLGSLNDVLWEGADKWTQPSMGDLLTAAQVKKVYRKACLVIHPDKQTGTENEALARAIFTELNDAWTAFENAGSPSL